MSDQKECPECHNQLVFSGDGRRQICERCGFSRPVDAAGQETTIEELIAMRRALSASRTADRSLRSTLKQGIGEFHDGRPEVAIDCFQHVVLKTGDHEEEMEAWLWLSRLVEDPREKRLCLEAVLAINPTMGEARRELAVLDGRIETGQLRGDQPPAAGAVGPQPAAVDQMRCPRCAGQMGFDPEQGKLVCGFCGYTEEATTTVDHQRDEQFGQGALEQDFDAAVHTIRGHSHPQAMRVFSCQGCGTEFVLASEALSLTCPYCAAVYVIEAAETAELIPPQGMIPFQITQDGAKKRLAGWFRERKINRNEISRLSPLLGMYMPVWTFDIGGEVQWHGKIIRGDRRTGQGVATPVFNAKYLFFDDFPILASGHQTDLFQNLMGSFDLKQVVLYDPRLVADWPAERYRLSVAEAAAKARGAVGHQIRRRPHGLDGGADLDPQSIHCSTSGVVIESYKLLLLPVWTFHYERDGRARDVLINGQSGEVVGDEADGLFSRLVSWFKND